MLNLTLNYSAMLLLPRFRLVMRPLSEEETKKVFEKLTKYIGRNLQLLLERKDGNYAFRLQKDRVYYMSEAVLKIAVGVPRDNLVSAGTCFGKFTHSGRFRLNITALDYIAQFAKYKMWIKPSGEMNYLYGNNVLKAHLGRITENTPTHQGVVFYTMADIPVGFGVSAQSTLDCRKVEATAIVGFHQTDIGEYLRIEENLT